MYKKVNSVRKSILSLFLAILSIFFFAGTLHAQQYQWTFMVYMDGDNNLESYAIQDFLEMAEVGSSDTIAIVVLFDRIDSDTTSFENWTDARRGIVMQGDEPDTSWGVSVGEVDMGDTQTLVDFIDWATDVEGYPAQNYALILWNHGDGWREDIERLRNQLRTKGKELSLLERENILEQIRILEQKVQGREHVWKAVCFDDTNQDALNIREIREAFEYLYNYEIIPGVDLIGFDACLMGMLEVAYEIKDYATVMVASEKTEPGPGWPYDTILQDLSDTPLMSAPALGDAIVTRYGESYEGDNTLSAVRLQAQYIALGSSDRSGVDVTGGIQALADAVSVFAQTVLTENHDDWDVIFESQQRAGWYYPYISYRDLEGFMEGVSDNAENDTIVSSAGAVITALDECLIANHSSPVDKGNGLSIYFPEWFWGDEYCEEMGQIDSDYNETNLFFLQPGEVYTQYWDDFLADYVDTYLVPNHTGEATYSRNIPGGTTASAYVMISSPVLPINPDPLANLEDDLGPYDNTQWRLFRWNPNLEPSAYEEYPFTGDDVELGKGYWLISRNTVDIDITGDLWETNMPYFIFLYPGWNQIGTPFYFDIDWDTVWVFWAAEPLVTHDRTTIVDGLQLDLILDAASLENVYTSRTLWKYENGDYSATAVMSPGEGYWIKNLTDDYVLLVVNPVRSTLAEVNMDSLEATLTQFARATEESPPAPPGGIDPEPDEEGNGSGGGKSGCFIATACFGSPMAVEVEVLRNFRDKYLLSNPIGQIFVSFYYRYSPPIARFIASHEFLKVMVRSSLYPIVKGCRLTIEDK